MTLVEFTQSNTSEIAAVDWAYFAHVGNWVLFVGGWLVILTVIVRRLASRLPDPWAEQLPARNAIPPEAVIFPILIWLFVGALFGYVADRMSQGERTPFTTLVSGDLAQLGGALACFWIASRFLDGGVRQFLIGQRTVMSSLIAAPAYWLAALAICPVILEVSLWIIRRFLPQYGVFEHEVIDALRTGDAPTWILWVGAAVIAPVAEECFFRGIVLTFAVSWLKKRGLAIALTGILFGVIHAGGGDSPQPHVVPALSALGMLLGVFYLRSGSLVGPIALHALFNLKTLIWESLTRGGA